MTGEAIVFGYACQNGKMAREPYSNAFDMGGYKTSEWRPLRFSQ